MVSHLWYKDKNGNNSARDVFEISKDSNVCCLPAFEDVISVTLSDALWAVPYESCNTNNIV